MKLINDLYRLMLTSGVFTCISMPNRVIQLLILVYTDTIYLKVRLSERNKTTEQHITGSVINLQQINIDLHRQLIILHLRTCIVQLVYYGHLCVCNNLAVIEDWP